jgi:hypothetical protein
VRLRLLLLLIQRVAWWSRLVVKLLLMLGSVGVTTAGVDGWWRHWAGRTTLWVARSAESVVGGGRAAGAGVLV